MKYRSILSSVTLSTIGLAGLAGCMESDREHRHGGRYDDTSIVFGIDQTKGTDGKVTTAVGYEMLDLLGHGSIARGVVTDELSCWAENLDDRLGQPHVEGGVAVFRGGLLPANGIAVLANRTTDLELGGAAWANAGDALTFEAKGFAMPDIAPSTLRVPSQDLVVASPADAAAEVAVPSTSDLTVSWTPSDPAATPENVVVSLDAVPVATPLPTGATGATGARGAELRCFFDRAAGTGHIPARLLARFNMLLGGQAAADTTVAPAPAPAPAPAIKGTLRIATHRQLTIFAKGGWTVYVVATAEQRLQPFSLTP
jgi:hypothetical protein